MTKEAYEKWKADHAAFCDMKFEGGSSGMEAEAQSCWKKSFHALFSMKKETQATKDKHLPKTRKPLSSTCFDD